MRFIVAGAAALLVSAVVLITAQVSARSTRTALQAAARSQTVLEARNLALVSDEALLSEFPELTLVPIVSELQKTRAEVVMAVIVDHQGVVQGHFDPRLLGTLFEPPRGLIAAVDGPTLHEGEFLWDTEATMLAEVPVIHDIDQIVGRAYVGVSKAPLEARIAASQQQIAGMGAILLPVVILAAVLLMGYLLRPISTLREGLERIGKGDLDTPMRVRDVTELGLLGEAVNDLAGQLKSSRQVAEEREREIVETQREIIHTLGQVVESRSTETATHVSRVGELSYHLGILSGLEEEKAVLLRQASPMHDVGKIGIPDDILNKPGRLTPIEYELMKSHAEIGFRILAKSQRSLLKAAAVVAYQHHEHWNGNGYPRGLVGEEIHIYGRIVAVVDVLDALMSDRCYRPAKPLHEVLGIIRAGRGGQFEPRLVDLLLEHLDEFLTIHAYYAAQDQATEAKIEVPAEELVPAVPVDPTHVPALDSALDSMREDEPEGELEPESDTLETTRT